jgi:two-component system CheB/CheR fusion protein
MDSEDNSRAHPFELQESTEPRGSIEYADAHPQVTDDDISPPRGQSFPVVGIGASAGGLEAFKQLLEHLPPDTGMSFVIVQHLDPHYSSHLAELLAPSTSMPVHTVQDGMHVNPNNVYVIPENTTMVLQDGSLRLGRRNPGIHLPIDTFFQSLAEVQGGRAIGIVLSGNASDGAQGIRAIKAECGLTFAQDERSAVHSGMPRSAIATGAVDFILPPAGIANELANIGRHPYIRPAKEDRPGEELLPEGDGELHKIFKLLHSRTNVDFSNYKQNTIRRRIGRRMIVCKRRTLADYTKFLSDHPSEVRELYRDFLISVTSFFRDPDVFEILSDLLKPRLAKRESLEQPIRIWVVGCATGEEAYSLAIRLQEILEDLRLSTPVQLFGTDISEVALSRARLGLYPEAIKEDVSPERLRRFFSRVDGSYQISKHIRENCIFARQDVSKDPPFAHVDLISCRNVLIYMNSALQRHILPVLHYSLNPEGLLLLGTAETVAAASDLFTEIDKAHHIYGRKPVPIRLTLDLAAGKKHLSNVPQPANVPAVISALELQRKADRILQNKYAPPAVVVDGDLQIIQFKGHSSAYLDPTPGQASLNLLRMAREGLLLPLRRVLNAAREQNVSARETGVRVAADGEQRQINLEVTPIAGLSPAERYYLVVFEELGTSPEPSAAFPPSTGEASPAEQSALETQVRDLRRQLAEAREYIRNLSEEHEAHEEELRAVNEEVRSANEELQSSNEELSTTKEEVQSANEELTTVNEELQTRNRELNAVNNDFTNLLSAVDIAIVMVDGRLRVRRFNSAAEKLFDLKPVDVGRAVGNLRGRIEIPELERLISQTLETLAVQHQEIQDREGRWNSVTVRPYRTTDDRIDGAVLAVVDIDALKKSLKAAEEARDYAEGLIETVREPLIVLDADLRVQRATSSFFETFEVSRRETIGRFLYDLGNGQWSQPRLRELLGDALFNDKPFQEYEVDCEFPHIGRRTFRLNACRIPSHSSDRPTVLLAFLDVTKTRQEAEVRYRRLFEAAKDGIVVLDAESHSVTDVNPYFLELTGFTREDCIGRPLAEIPPFQTDNLAGRFLTEVRQRETVRFDEAVLISRFGAHIDIDLVGNRYTPGNREVIQLNVRDVTDRKKGEEQIRASLREKETLLKEIHHRVKNNLQVIASLMRLQSDFVRDERLGALVEEMHTRIRSIATIHEILYASNDLSTVDFGGYLQKLARDLFALYNVDPDKIRLHTDIGETRLDIAQAVPCGLIVNELLTNSLKYAFRDDRPGVIQVSLQQYGGNLVLEVGDNGVGLPPDLDFHRSTSMGLELVNLLTEQLEGTLALDRTHGTRFTVSFPSKPE